jgi:phosphopantetheinyl transferase
MTESKHTDKELGRLNAGLEVLAGRYKFEFELVNMDEIEHRLEKDDGFISVFSESELNYLHSLKLGKNRIQWLAGRYAVKSALFKYKLGSRSILNLNCIDVLKGQDSASCIAQYPGICCSISHSFPYCVGMVSDRRAGVDLERIFHPNDSLVRFYYSKLEQEALISCKDKDEYSKKAMVFWTRKEALSKYFGLGMKMNFKELDTTDGFIQSDLLPGKNICLVSIESDTFCLSLAV